MEGRQSGWKRDLKNERVEGRQSLRQESGRKRKWEKERMEGMQCGK